MGLLTWPKGTPPIGRPPKGHDPRTTSANTSTAGKARLRPRAGGTRMQAAATKADSKSTSTAHPPALNAVVKYRPMASRPIPNVNPTSARSGAPRPSSRR